MLFEEVRKMCINDVLIWNCKCTTYVCYLFCCS